MTIEAIGHGAGKDRPGPLPNVLRAVLGRAAGVGADRVVCLETNLDDLVPEHFDYLMERLFEAGALDVSLPHVQMKKNRPGFLVRVLARPSERLRLARTLFAESTAIGVRVSEADRIVLRRELREVDTPFGPIGVKVVWDAEGAPHASAEYDDCKRAARKHGVPLREVVRAAEEPRAQRCAAARGRGVSGAAVRVDAAPSISARADARAAALCLHGLTGTPYEVRPLGEALARARSARGRPGAARSQPHARGARRACATPTGSTRRARRWRAARDATRACPWSGSRSAACSSLALAAEDAGRRARRGRHAAAPAHPAAAAAAGACAA